MFENTLKQLVEQVDGARGAAVISTSGVVIDAVDGQGGDARQDAATAYASVYEQLLSVGEAVELGEVTRFTVVGDDEATLVRVLAPNYLLALQVPPDTLLAKAHFQIRVAAPDIAREL